MPLAADRGRASAGSRLSPYLLIAGAALLLAAASLALGAAPAYDPWAWIIWGREILHGHLVTTGGPTWKPLPVVFTTAFAPFGAAAPDLWLLVARAGGVMALGLAALLAYRLASPAGRPGRILAAALAPAGLLALSQYALSVAQGESEGLLFALVLLAILRHRDGAHRQALWLGFAAALIRPETWPFLALYGLWLWRADAAAHALIAALLALVPVLWFGPELWGSGSAARGVQWARYARAGSPALARCPFCAELKDQAWPLVTGPVKVGVVLALLLAGRRSRMLAGLALAWILEEAVLTQLGFSGSERYLIAPVALLTVVAAVGFGAVLRARRLAIAATAAAVAISLIVIPGRVAHLGAMRSTLRYDARLRSDTSRAVSAAGGARRLTACGPLQTNPSEAPLTAWTLGTRMLETESSHGAVVIRSANAPGARALPDVPAGYKLLAAAGAVKVYAARSVSAVRLARCATHT